MQEILEGTSGFHWDQANIEKNWERHSISFFEAEEVFFHDPVIIPDAQHSQREIRYVALGKTRHEKLLTIIFTIRRKIIRIISARPMSRKERIFYAHYKENPSF